MINSILKGPASDIKSVRTSLFNNNYDSAHINYRQDNASVEINVDWASSYKSQKLEVFCEKGFYVFEDSQPDPNKKLYLVEQNYDLDALSNKAFLEKKYIKIESSSPLLNECKHFIESIKNKTKPRTDATEAIRVLEVLIGVENG